MPKKAIALLLAVVLLLSFSVPAFAATDSDGNIFTSIFSGLKEAANFLKRLIVPDPNYFHNKLADLSRRVNERFGGLGQLYQIIDNFFKVLNSAQSASIMFKTPNNFLFRGYQGVSINVLEFAKPFTDFLRNVLNAAACLFTAVICYKKLLTFFEK